MHPSMVLYAMLITLYGAINYRLVASTDNTNNNNKALEHSEAVYMSDSICSNREKNVAVDVILIDNKPLNYEREGILKRINKRHASNDKRNAFKDRPRPDQKSLLIIFDGTGSMHDDLQQLRSGAQEIINDLSSRDDSPIFNYVLIVFRDPTVDPPFETRNPDELLEKLKYINVGGGGDCPEMALSGLKIGLKLALPNSFAYVFSDASSKDYGFYDEVVTLIQKKQVTVNFLLTGACNQENEIMYKVYHKLSRVSNGQVYDMNKKNVKDVLIAIRDTVKHNYAALKSVDVEQGGKSRTDLNVDRSISELKVSIVGRNPQLSIRDPGNVTVTGDEELTLTNLKLVNIKDPKDGVWHIEAGAESSHSIRLSAISDLKFEFGFSLEQVERKSETAFQPLLGHKNILTLFVSDPSLVKDLFNITIILVPSSPSEETKQFVVLLQKREDNIYATKAFDVPRQMFKIQLNGVDVNGNAIERLISTGLISSKGSAPELNIEANQKEIYEGDTLQLKCTVKSHIPITITWSFNDEILKTFYSNQSNELELIVQNVQHSNHGIYKCLAGNKISTETDEISISIMTLPKVKITPSSEVMMDGLMYSLRCDVDDTKEQKVKILWLDGNGTVIQDGGAKFSFSATYLDNGKEIRCRAVSKDFVVEDEFFLNIYYQPRFTNLKFESPKKYTYGSNAIFDCWTSENPKLNSIKWLFTPQNRNDSREVSNHNNSTLIISELFEEHEGQYKCIVSNEVGSVEKEFTVVLVPREPPNVTINEEIVFAKEGENLELFCECSNCLPLTNFTWTYENEKIHEQFFIKNQEENFFKAIMKLSNVDETDKGTYQCSMWNSLGEKKVSIELLIQITPKIEGIILNSDENEFELDEYYEVLEGRNFSVECLVDGFPEPKIYWMRNEEKISNESLLNIDNLRLDDEGDYECIAENNMGVTKKGFHVEINYPPRKKREINTSFEVVEDKIITLTCDLIGNPKPHITWEFNSLELNSSYDKYEIDDNFLKFLASVDDSGIYKCTGMNKFGNSSIDFSVIVKSSPQILSLEDESLKLSTNSTLKLNCDATGYPKPNVRFLKNSFVISNQSSFEIKSVTFSDSGSYSCVAENEVGQAEKIFYVTIVEKPKIISSFENITVLNNNTFQVMCSATGIPNPTITWRHGENQIISTNDSVKIDSSFESGIISCSAANSEGSDQKSFHVEVVKIPIILPVADDLTTNVQVKENDDMEFLCPFENYEELKWTFNGDPLVDVQHKLVDKKLYVLNVNSVHNGNWTCTVTNKAGGSEFSYNVDILTSPTVFASWNLDDRISEFFYTESDIDEKVLKRGENLKLNCTVNGKPLPKVQWRKSADLIGEGEVLAIDNLDFHHSDIYTCSAENSLGSVKKFFKVDVVSAPYIDDSVSIQTKFQKMPGDSVILKCNSIIANPVPLYFWFKDNEILDDDVDDHMIIESLDTNNDGKYRCLAKNKLGSVKIDFEISIYQPAKILEAKEEEDLLRSNEMRLRCSSQGNPMPIISWTLNGHVLSTTSKLNVNKLLKTVNDNTIYFDGYGNGISFLDPFKLSLSKQKFYSKLTKIDSKTLKLELIFKNKHSLHLNKFFCYSFNALGSDKKSIEVKINQKPQLVSPTVSKVNSFEILENMPMLLSCLIEGFPQPQITWYKNGHKIYENETIEFLKNRKFLRVSESKSWNTGNYSCNAKNEMGEMELKFNVLILSPPNILTQPNANFLHDDKHRENNNTEENEEYIDVLKGSNVILECNVEASPKAKIHWVKLNFDDPILENELLKTEEHFLSLNSVQKSSSFMCYANNTIGNVQKFFHIKIQYSPMLIENVKSEESLSVKLHHSVNLECKIKSSPEPLTYWSLNSTNITKSTTDYYFTSDNQIMRIINANRNHEGKYACTSVNKLGWVQRVFYVRVEIPIQYSPWSDWSECSSTCGSSGVQYRSRTCVLIDSMPSYNCSGENVQMRKCNDIPCPINGGWGNWSNWSSCPRCYDTTQSAKPKQKRIRKCDNPFPSFGGINCIGNDEEEKDCKLSPCPINGNWSAWSAWSACSKTCGKGFKSRKRLCNNPTPMYNGRTCDGENYEYEECKLKQCSNAGMLKSLRNDYYDESTEQYGPEFEIKKDENGNSKVFQFLQRREMEYSPPLNNQNLKVKVTLDTYKPISEETYNQHLNSVNTNKNNELEDYFETESHESSETTESSIKSTAIRNCGQGFKYNHKFRQCEELDECKLHTLNTCRRDERCINTVGSYRCEKA